MPRNNSEEPDFSVYVFDRHNSSTWCHAHDMSRSVFYLFENVTVILQKYTDIFFCILEKPVEDMSFD